MPLFDLGSFFGHSWLGVFMSFRYNGNLDEAKKNGVKKGLFVGGSLGFVFFLQFCAFALAFWYGAKLIREQPENYDGGNIITVSTP